jgi:hypothetical protein
MTASKQAKELGLKSLTQVSELIKPYKSIYAAAKALEVSQTQLQRWIDAGALVDEAGDIYIKTKGSIKCSKN